LERHHYGDEMRRFAFIHSRQFQIFVVFLLALTVRGLTANFINRHLADPAWFQAGTYAHFDQKAKEILDGKSSVFWIDDPTRTETAVYPPGYPLWVAAIYKLTGDRSAASVQSIQWVLDANSILLIIMIAFLAFSWRVAIVSGLSAALSPLLVLSGASPMADAPTSWIVLTGVVLLLLAAKRNHLVLAFAAGAVVALSCWFRANAMMLPFFWAAAMFLVSVPRRRRLLLAAMILVGSAIVLTPLLLRNAAAFHVFTPSGLGVGTNLWEGIGETDRASEFGAVFGDANLIEQERKELGVAADAEFKLYYPDGVQRDRERTRKAFAVIRSHPIWYAGVMLRRMGGMLKYAGEPVRYMGSAGINVTARKSLSPQMQKGVLGPVVTGIGMVQSVMRYLLLPLIIVGIALAFRQNWRMSTLLFSTALYYLVVGSALHAELRYGLPMQAILIVFAGAGMFGIFELVRRNKPRIHTDKTDQGKPQSNAATKQEKDASDKLLVLHPGGVRCL
jgi:4-amino-4-deoxy-L-arabinose transferase-like glycosyltransferase